MKFKLGISPCPNDTFMFDAIINKKIDTKGIEFEPYYYDIEELNRLSLKGELDVSKLSCFSYFNVAKDYVILDAGAALGYSVGPLLISNPETQFQESNIASYKIALPGVNTTANFLFTNAYPKAKNKIFVRFDLIEEYVLSKKADLGVIIHEGRFTYNKKGLNKIHDLGFLWQEKTNLPIPLGCIVIKRSLGKDLANTISEIINKSIQFAFDYPESSLDFVKYYAQELELDVIKQHIKLYVNKFSLHLGKKGREALMAMHDFALNNFSLNNKCLNNMFL